VLRERRPAVTAHPKRIAVPSCSHSCCGLRASMLQSTYAGGSISPNLSGTEFRPLDIAGFFGGAVRR
jgi:hypothetical protein